MIVTIGDGNGYNTLKFLDLKKLRYPHRHVADRNPDIKSLSIVAEQYDHWSKVSKLNKKDRLTVDQVGGRCESIAISPDGRMVALGLDHGEVYDPIVLLWAAFSLE